MKKAARILLFAYLLICLFAYFPPTVLAQGSPGLEKGATGTNWVQDPAVTELGKNSERAREFLFWVFSHSPIYSAPVLGQMWGLTRNIAYAFVVLTIIGLAAHLVLSRKNIGPTFSGVSLGYDVNINLVSIALRVVGVLLFITFSYLLVLGLIQFAEIMMRFFIEHVGGCDLFNIKFAGSGSKCIFNPADPNYRKAVMEMEKNYTQFVGYRDTNAANLEMVNTSFFLIKLTSLTYNVISAILILRQVILWFFLIVSPFLALLLPFIFIRNTGWIWIGEFFRWLFYGPLTALFIASLAKIWKAGIPYAFDFSRVNKPIGQIYPTAINILYGGPAQTLTQTNSANYVDTYAEYVIALIMLWAAIFLPWLLLRIFRDYCCDILKQNQATLLQILNKLRGAPTPPPAPAKPGPAETAGRAFELPFRRRVSAPERLTRERVIEKIKEKQIEKVETRELARAMNLAVSSLQDVARIETSKEANLKVRSNLSKIQNPTTVGNLEERKTYSSLRQELFSRAARGDQVARQITQATQPKASQILRVTPQVSSQTLKKAVEKPGAPVVIPQITRVPTAKMAPVITPSLVSSVSQKTQVPQDKVEKILKTIPLISGNQDQKASAISQKVALPTEKVKEVLKEAPSPAAPAPAPAPAAPKITVEDYEEVKTMWLNHYRGAEIPVSEKIKTRQDWISEDIKKLTNALNLLIAPEEENKQKGLKEVANILPFLLLGGFSDLEILTYLKAKLEAAKQVKIELEKIEKAKEEAKKEEEEEKIKVPLEEKKEQEKQMEAEAAKEQKIPKEEINK